MKTEQVLPKLYSNMVKRLLSLNVL